LVEQRITPTGVGTNLASVRRREDAGTPLAEVGTTIRRVRRELGLTLRDVGRATGFSISFLSLVERGRSSISLTSLHTLAVALGVDMRVFFPAQPEAVTGAHVTRRAGDTRLPVRGTHTYRLLGASGFDRALEPLLVTIAPGTTDAPPDDHAHDGEEFAYVLSGAVVFTVDGVENRLEAGDAVHFKATVPHLVRNDETRPAEVLWVLTPRLF
jgi:transcriptional regulator with XRE-family HTH domain